MAVIDLAQRINMPAAQLLKVLLQPIPLPDGCCRIQSNDRARPFGSRTYTAYHEPTKLAEHRFGGGVQDETFCGKGGSAASESLGGDATGMPTRRAEQRVHFGPCDSLHRRKVGGRLTPAVNLRADRIMPREARRTTDRPSGSTAR